jgi:hypothetical protein
MGRIVDAIDAGWQHPDEIIRDYMHKYEGEFQLAMPAGPAPNPKDDKDKGSTSRTEPKGGGDGWCPGWTDNGKCSAPGGSNKCRFKHPEGKCGIGLLAKKKRNIKLKVTKDNDNDA